MFAYATHPDRGDGRLSDTLVGVILLLIALFLLCACLVLIVKLLSSLFRGQIAHLLRKFINADFPGCAKHFTGYLAIVIGAGLTILVQSSSIFTSSITPLVGIGVLGIDRMYPLTLGSNIGTTATGVLAAFAQKSNVHLAMQIALCHLFFNVFGILVFYPFPFFRPPIAAAKFLGERTAKYRWFSVMYLIVSYGLFPLGIFALSLASWIAMAAICIPFGLLLIAIFTIKLMQKKRPKWLPNKLRTWKWLPAPLRSLEPYDRALVLLTCNCGCCRLLGCCKSIIDDQDVRAVKRSSKVHNSDAMDQNANNTKANGHSSFISNGAANGHVVSEVVKVAPEGYDNVAFDSDIGTCAHPTTKL